MVILAAGAVHADDEAQARVEALLALNAKVKAFSAILEIREDRGFDESVATSSLVVSRDHGWRLEGGTEGAEHTVVNDFNVSYDYYPWDKTVFKATATGPEMKRLFRRPADELNPLMLLDPASLRLIGEGEFEGEPVVKFEGTTSTRLLPSEPAVVRQMEAWISTRDGLPRKTVEGTGETTATTIYRHVKVNPPVSAKDFQFEVPPGVKVIDVNASALTAPESEAAPAAPAREDTPTTRE
jgi:outer membrane lipoprotein-sorting protein